MEFSAQAFAMTDAFCAWEEAKEALSRAALSVESDEGALKDAWRRLNESEARLKDIQLRVAKAAPLAVKATILGEYERNDPRRRAAWRLNEAPNNQLPTPNFQRPNSLRPSGQELLQDTALAELRIKPPTGSMDLEWVVAGAWRGHGEPYETRRISLEKSEGTGKNSGLASLVMKGCKQETILQFATAEPGKWYAARVKVRGQVSPGNMTYLVLNFQDAARRTLGLGVVDRLPVGEWGLQTEGRGARAEAGVELVVWAQAPANAQWVGMGVRALNQVDADYAAFSGFSLQAIAPE